LAPLKAVAGRADVRFVANRRRDDDQYRSVLSEGDRTHRADTARTTYATKGGSGIKVGVMSDGVNSLAAFDCQQQSQRRLHGYFRTGGIGR